MSVLVYIDQSEGSIKKASLEAASYANETAKKLGTTSTAVVIGSTNDKLESLGNYGIKKVYHFVDLVILILKIYKCFKMKYVVKEINGLEIVKKRKKT